MKSSRRIVLRGVAAAAAVLAVSACSSSSKSSTATTAATPTSASGSQTTSASSTPTGTPIKVGVVCSCTGPLASTGVDTVPVLKAWASSVNDAGGINGHPIDLVVKDDASTPGTSQAAADSLIQSDHVIAIVDDTNDDETWAAQVKSAGVPVVGLNSSETPFFTSSDFYPEAQTEDSLFASILDSAKSAGATNLGLLYCAEAVQCQEGIAPLKQAGQKLGLPVTFSAEVAATAPNYTAQCLAAQQAHVTALFIADIGAVAQKVAQDCLTQGYHPIYVLDGQTISQSYASSPGLKDNLVGPTPNVPFFANTPAVQEMNAAIDKYQPGLRQDAVKYNEYAMGAWVSGKLFEKGAQLGGLGANGSTPSSAQLVNGLNMINNETLGGLAPPLTFTAGQPHPVDCWFNFAIKNGSYQLPNGTSTTCQ